MNQLASAHAASDLAHAVALHQQRDWPGAEAIYRNVLRANPNVFDALHLLGCVCLQTDRHAEAADLIERAIAVDARHAGAFSNLGVALLRLNRPAEALHAFDTALAGNPADVTARSNRADALHKLGRLAEAESACRAALATDPSHADALSNLGNVLRDRGDLAASESACRHAIAMAPGHPAGYGNLGNVLHDQGRHDEAAACYRHTLAALPGSAEAHNNLGNALLELGRFDEAAACYGQALKLHPNHAESYSNKLFSLNYGPSISAENIFDAYRDWDGALAHRLAPGKPPPIADPDPGRRLRVGYVSPDFRRHACRFFILPLFERLNRTAVEVHAYADVKSADAATAEIRAASDHWHDTTALSDGELTDLVRRDGIDILVDLAGHTRGNRLLVFARKPAPVQVSWLGFAYTTGLTAMDYFVADPHFVPDGADHLFSEAVHRLPRTALCYRPPADMPDVGPLQARRSGVVTFGYFSRAVRLNERVTAAWARILAALPGARLMLNGAQYSHAGMQDDIRRRFAGQGVAADRLVMTYSSPPFESYNAVDIALDPFPHNAGTTTFEALWMGVPVLTLAGRPSVGRLGASVLRNAGLDDWVATDEGDYVARAVAAAGDLESLAALRAGMRERMQASPLMDEADFAWQMEAAYRIMWRRACENR